MIPRGEITLFWSCKHCKFTDLQTATVKSPISVCTMQIIKTLLSPRDWIRCQISRVAFCCRVATLQEDLVVAFYGYQHHEACAAALEDLLEMALEVQVEVGA